MRLDRTHSIMFYDLLAVHERYGIRFQCRIGGTSKFVSLEFRLIHVGAYSRGNFSAGGLICTLPPDRCAFVASMLPLADATPCRQQSARRYP